jgi:hypothetical protein
MNIGLLDVDGHNFPNLPLMKISAYHKARGDSVDWAIGHEHYDVLYMSKIFTFTPDDDRIYQADEIIKGGTGYGIENKLSNEIENMCPDYTLYPQFGEAYGFMTRGCPNNCPFCIVTKKEGNKSRQVAELDNFYRQQKTIKLLDPNLLACSDREKILQSLIDSRAYIDFTQGLDIRLIDKDIAGLINLCKIKMLHFAWDQEKDSDVIIKNLQKFKEWTGIDRRKAAVYLLTNFDTGLDFDLERIYTLRRLRYDPYVMIYDKENAPRHTRMLQRWVNNKRIFRTTERFEDYDPSIG